MVGLSTQVNLPSILGNTHLGSFSGRCFKGIVRMFLREFMGIVPIHPLPLVHETSASSRGHSLAHIFEIDLKCGVGNK